MRKFQAKRNGSRYQFMASSAAADTYRDANPIPPRRPRSERFVLTSTNTPSAARPTRQRRPVVRRPRQPLWRFLMSMSPAAWMAVDWLIIGLTARATCTVLVLSTGGYKWLANPWLMSATFCVSVTVAGLVFGLYERPTLQSRSRILLRSALSLSLGVALAFAGLTLFFYAYASRWIGLSVFLAYLLAAVPLRLFAHQVISTSPVRLICVGAGQSVRKLVGILGHLHRQHYQVLGHVRVQQGQGDRPPTAGAGVPLLLSSAGDGHAERGRSPSGAAFQTEADLDFEAACPCLGGLDQVIEILATHAVDEIVVASELASDPAVGRAVAPCLEGRCRVTDQATFVEKLLGEVPAESITAEWFLRADVQNRGNYEAVSRTMDLCAAAVGLLLTLPLWPLIALLIRLDSRGPVLFRQVRVGQHGRCFSIRKFRTMRPDAEKDGVRWAQRNDARVTRVGRYLRKSRLDELPQLLNILRGDMSLVGPRPERPEFVHNLEQLLPHYRLRHLIRPGLTGWAQIHYGYGSNVADAHRKLCYDLYYLKHRSVELDLAILIRTFGTFVLGAR